MGARRIAGITVEIGGETTELTTALKDVDISTAWEAIKTEETLSLRGDMPPIMWMRSEPAANTSEPLVSGKQHPLISALPPHLKLLMAVE